MTSTLPTALTATDGAVEQYDVVIIGAGVSGLYQLYRLRQLGLSVRCYEDGSGVGGSPAYRKKCNEVATKGYEGFLLQ